MSNEEFVEMKDLAIQCIIGCEALLGFKVYCFYMVLLKAGASCHLPSSGPAKLKRCLIKGKVHLEQSGHIHE